MKRPVYLLAMLYISTGCATAGRGLSVDLRLSSVQRPADVAARWGEYSLAEADSTGYTYQDGLVSMAVVPAGGSFSAVIENRSQHSVRLLWGDASYVGPTGFSSGVVPGDTRWVEMNNIPGAQTIPSMAKAAVVVIPKANADVQRMQIREFYPITSGCEVVPGTSIRLVLPFEIEGVVNEYSFLFEPKSAAIVEWKTDLMTEVSTLQNRTPCW